MNLTDRIQIKSQHTSNSVFRTIETQEQLEKLREDTKGYDVTVMPTIHNNMAECESCSA